MEWVASLSPRGSGGDGAQPERISCAMLAVVRKVSDLSRVGSALRNWHRSVLVWFAWVAAFVYRVRVLNVGVVNDRFAGFLG
jgi:hypothetical protein